MSKSKSFAHELLEHVLNNRSISNLGDKSGLRPSSASGAIYLSLHSANPIALHQEAYETNYSGYARVALRRNGSMWKVISNKAELTTFNNFPKVKAEFDKRAVWLGVGGEANGKGMIMWSGKLQDPIKLKKDVVPRIKAGTSIKEY